MPSPRKRRSTSETSPAAPAAAQDQPQQEKDTNDPEVVSADGQWDRIVMIAQAAYFRAEKRDFMPGHELEDWLAAEQEINDVLSNSRFQSSPAATAPSFGSGRTNR